MGKQIKKKLTKKSKKKPEGYVFGRPSKYDSKYCQMMIDYFNRIPYEKVKRKLVVSDFPTFEGFANKICTTTNTIVDWTEKHEDFLLAYRQCKAYQKDILTQNGLRGNYATLFAKFVAINATDMKEKTEVEHSGGISVIEVPQRSNEDDDE